ncbi:hypothetical protein SALBM311S_06837 [Streptomyces alboniger]
MSGDAGRAWGRGCCGRGTYWCFRWVLRGAGCAARGDSVGRDGHERGRRGPFGTAAGDGVRAAAERFRRRGSAARCAAGRQDGADVGWQPTPEYGGRPGGARLERVGDGDDGCAAFGWRGRRCRAAGSARAEWVRVRLSAGAWWRWGARYSAAWGSFAGCCAACAVFGRAGWVLVRVSAGGRRRRTAASGTGRSRSGTVARAERRGHRRRRDEQGGASDAACAQWGREPAASAGRPGYAGSAACGYAGYAGSCGGRVCAYADGVGARSRRA